LQARQITQSIKVSVRCPRKPKKNVKQGSDITNLVPEQG
jgi:hypothetical protein